ncbi:MAG: hypothetical protein Q8K96_18275 [Rubrivivax sp.]|nr:hypothetical protein [Rubrivivax sp.]
MFSKLWQRLDAAITVALVGVAVVGIETLGAFDKPAGPGTEVTGIVQGATFKQNDAPPAKVVAVLLPDGTTVRIITRTDLMVVAGQSVQVLVHRRRLTGRATYTIDAAKPKAP